MTTPVWIKESRTASTEGVDCTLFVDDVGLIFVGSNANNTMLLLNNILSRIYRWSRQNYVVFDPAKFQAIDTSKYKIPESKYIRS